MTHPQWQLSLEVAGTGLEFIDQHYPELCSLLRILVDRGQIELISSLYTPNMWPAFPMHDLLKSIDLNRKCLQRLGFQWTRIFFSQEAFFGLGLSALRDHFDIAVCKDDYINHFCEHDFTNPCLKLGDIKVVVASSHLLNELTLFSRVDGTTWSRGKLQHRHIRALARAGALNDSNNFPAARGEYGQTRWLWYHCGDGNHFGTTVKPDDLHNCYFDPLWNDFCISLLEHYEDDGYQLGTIKQFVDSLDFSNAKEFPLIPEGSWNSSKSQGVFCWMGRHNTPWERDCSVLTSISQARARIVAAERVAQRVNVSSGGKCLPLLEPSTRVGDCSAADRARLDKAWSSLLHAQISDALGWHAGPRAVLASLEASESSLALASQSLDRHAVQCSAEIHSICRNELFARSIDLVEEVPETRLFGASGDYSCTHLASHVIMYDYEFEAREEQYGVIFPFTADRIVYCPTAQEDMPVAISPESLKITMIYLPLSNGLVQISANTFLIKDTSTVHIAASIDTKMHQVSFAVQGAKTKEINRWRFYLAMCDLKEAVKLANKINHVRAIE